MPDGSKVYVVENYLDLAVKALRQSLNFLLRSPLLANFILCVENNTHFHFKFINQVLPEFFASGHLFLGWDVGHSYRGEPQIEEFILKYKDYIKHIHLHDVKDGRDHRVIGEGEINFTNVRQKIKQCQNLERILIEVRTLAGIKQSLKNLLKGGDKNV